MRALEERLHISSVGAAIACVGLACPWGNAPESPATDPVAVNLQNHTHSNTKGIAFLQACLVKEHGLEGIASPWPVEG